MKFIQNANRSISILDEFHTEYTFEGNNSLLIHKPQFFPAIFSSPQTIRICIGFTVIFM